MTFSRDLPGRWKGEVKGWMKTKGYENGFILERDKGDLRGQPITEAIKYFDKQFK